MGSVERYVNKTSLGFAKVTRMVIWGKEKQKEEKLKRGREPVSRNKPEG